MTDNEIIKALECCVRSVTIDACLACPLNDGRRCDEDLYALEKLALDLTNRQKAEIESAKKAAEEAIRSFNRMESLYHIKCTELKTAKAEAIKEFAERLKNEARIYDEFDGTDEYFYLYVTVDDIDNLAKEMTEGKDAGKDI